jgi:RNA polymerase sigma-70 factor (ECF subfamily)
VSAPARLSAVWSGGVDDAVAEPSSSVVDRLREGDATALALLYRQHHEAVRAFARRLVGDATIAEDLVHDVFLAVPAAFRRYRGDAEIRSFLVSIAVNKAKQHVRAAVRARAMRGRLAAEPTRVAAEAPDEEWERRELCAELQRALDELPIEQRVVVVLCAVEERTALEVSAIVGAPENTVRTRLFHAKRKLREIMGGSP